MGVSEGVISALESMLHGWNFEAIDTRGRLGVVALGWKQKGCKCENAWIIDYGLALELFVEELGRNVIVLNIYGPYHDKVRYWEYVFSRSFMNGQRFIIGGDLNFIAWSC
jgi:hypothetical protein